jgi:hypothetical protein
MELVEIFIETNEKETKDQTYTMHGDMFKNKKLGFTVSFFQQTLHQN